MARVRTSRRTITAVAAAAVSFALLTAVALLAYLDMEARTLETARAHTERVARSESTLVQYWLEERASDISIMSEVSRVRTEFPKYLAGDMASKAWLEERLETERDTRNYYNVSLYTVEGKRALSFGGSNPTADAEFARLAASVATATATTVMTSHIAPLGGYRVTWFTPLVIHEAGKPSVVTGVISYEADLREYLRGVVKPEQAPWPTIIEFRIVDAGGVFTARSDADFRFESSGVNSATAETSLKSSVVVPMKGASISASVLEAEVKDGLAWARHSVRLADMLVLVVFSLFVWAYARSEKNRLAEIEARESITDALATQDRFLNAMSHNLRTPLNSIIGFSSLMGRGLAGEVNEEQSKQLAMIEASGRHLLALVTDVLDLSKTRAGAESVRPEWIVVSEPVEFVTEVLTPAVAEKRLTWSVDVPPSLEVRTDRRLLERILLSLAGNAIKFTHDGFVKITVAEVGPNDEVAFTISDSGVGITQESLGVIMQDFQQVELPDFMKPEGLGLGLSISNTTARLLGGRIDVESTPGVGSAFTLVLPRNAGAVS